MITNIVASITVSLTTNWITTEIITPIEPPNPVKPIVIPVRRLRQRAEVIENHTMEFIYRGKHLRWHVGSFEVTNSIPMREISADEVRKP
jgi:hypothetical protein